MKAVALAVLLAACTHPSTPAPAQRDESCAAIAADIELLRARFPALVEYRTGAAMKRDCAIEYGWHTHPPTGRGGWSAAVPNPDRDGVWLYIGLFDPTSPEASDQINTQPVLPDWHIGTRKVTFLILEGDAVRGLGDAIVDVLRHHGLREGSRSTTALR